MSALTDTELDGLFFDGDEEFVDLPQSRTFSLFNSLPPELRNMIYQHYFDAYSSSNPAIKINTSGQLIKAPLIYTCRNIHLETQGYFHTYFQRSIQDSTLHIEAQVLEYSPKPLQITLCALSEQFSVPKEDLARRTKVTFIGCFNFANIMDWVNGHLANHIDTPIYAQHQETLASLPTFGAIDMFAGELSIVEAVRHRRKWGYSLSWRIDAQEVLDCAEYLGFGPGRYEGKDIEGLSIQVFKVMAEWHHVLRHELGSNTKRMSAKRLAWLRTNHHDMGSAVYWHKLCCY
jgi:hypothetical protein